MRAAFILLLALTTSLKAVETENLRKWTESESKKVIEARIVDKTSDNAKARLEFAGGTQVWVEASRLSEKDKEYIRKWIKPIKHITARVVGSSKGGKKISVTVKAGSRHLSVSAYRYPGDRKPIKKKLKPGGEVAFTYTASNRYIVKAWSGGKLVDRESWDSKTGL